MWAIYLYIGTSYSEGGSFKSLVFVWIGLKGKSSLLLLLFAHSNLSIKVTSHFPPGNFAKVLIGQNSQKKSTRAIRLGEEINSPIYTLEHAEEMYCRFFFLKKTVEYFVGCRVLPHLASRFSRNPQTLARKVKQSDRKLWLDSCRGKKQTCMNF